MVTDEGAYYTLHTPSFELYEIVSFSAFLPYLKVSIAGTDGVRAGVITNASDWKITSRLVEIAPHERLANESRTISTTAQLRLT